MWPPDPDEGTIMTDVHGLPEHVARNRDAWDAWAIDYVAAGERAWAADEPRWGVFGIPESQAHILPESVDGLDAIELGCGTGYISAWLARRGARPIGIDNSAQQLATARRLQDEHELHYPLLHGNAEHVPLPHGCCDPAGS
jgi:2-polyprenyl-3-methyl-5-hydroxy-6-metoxy-1,4-benzoquinol methylase